MEDITSPLLNIPEEHNISLKLKITISRIITQICWKDLKLTENYP